MVRVLRRCRCAASGGRQLDEDVAAAICRDHRPRYTASGVGSTYRRIRHHQHYADQCCGHVSRPHTPPAPAAAVVPAEGQCGSPMDSTCNRRWTHLLLQVSFLHNHSELIFLFNNIIITCIYLAV